jgi:mannose/fructose-specific phosphotransferase system component IIA
MNKFFGADNVFSACVTQENGTADLKKTVEAYLQEWGNEQVVICSDLKGGSANQTVFPFLTRPDTYVVSGMNLSLAIQLQMEDAVTLESLQDIIRQAKEDLVLINTLDMSCSDDDE